MDSGDLILVSVDDHVVEPPDMFDADLFFRPFHRNEKGGGNRSGAPRPVGRCRPRLPVIGTPQEGWQRDRQRAEPCFGSPGELRPR